MTRPQIIRADTIDLQDQSAPSAQDHTRSPFHSASQPNGPAAPHQASELRHVRNERAAEEVALTNAWNNGHNLSEEPPSEDDDMYMNGHDLDGDTLLPQNDDILSRGDDHGMDDDGEDGLDDDGMDKISSSPSISDEDIDFEFVYALHNFVATVEGQANAAKGDTMVLLDDSNSYWWLVRVVKDSTIGYLPAEHIETPTERLARLNKHRNIDACKMMYEDTLEKPKNPLRRAMRRRGQKQVTFTDPTYRDAPQYDYSSEEEEDGENGELGVNGVHDENATQNGVDQAQNDATVTSSAINAKNTAATQVQSVQDSTDEADEAAVRTSDEYVERIGPGKSRNGTVRNTDSFFKDETVETRKITLTPNLLRDDNSPSLRVVENIKERTSSSFDLDKNDRYKEDKKKEKKGVLGIFKRRKDKKNKFNETESLSSKTSTELSRESPVSSEKSSILQDSNLQRKTSKNGRLQKQPATGQRGITSPNGINQSELATTKSSADSSPFESHTTSRAESPERPTPVDVAGVRSPTGDAGVRSPANPVPNGILKTSSQDIAAHGTDSTGRLSESPVHVTAADAEPPALVRDSSSSDSDDVRSFQDTPSPQMPNGTSLDVSHVNGAHHSPISPTATQNGLGASRTPPHPNRSPPPQPNGTPSPLTVVPISAHQDRQGSTSTTASAAGMSSAPSTPVWSDASLRQYLDESGTADIRDLLLLTRDTTGIVPVGPDHPLMAGLYVEERGKVKEMGDALDGLLGNWLEKKMRSKSSMSLRKPTKMA